MAQDIFIHVCLSPLARLQRLHLGEGAEATGGHTEILSPQLALVQRQQLSVLVLLDALGLDAVREDLRHLTRPIDVPAKGVQVVLSGSGGDGVDGPVLLTDKSPCECLAYNWSG